MPEVLRHLESVKNRNSECERKTTPTETSTYDGAPKVSTKTERETTERDSETSKYGDAQKVSTKTERQATERVCMALNKSCTSILKLNGQYCLASIKPKCHLLGY